MTRTNLDWEILTLQSIVCHMGSSVYNNSNLEIINYYCLYTIVYTRIQHLA